MSSQDLTTLAAVKSWLGLPSTASPNDATLSALITAASRAIYAALGRPALLPQTYAETIDAERPRVFLRNWPVLQINSVLLDGIAVPQAPAPGPAASFGYRLKPGDLAPPGAPQALDLLGWCVRCEPQNLIVNYLAGYAIQSEAQTAPASSPWTLPALAPFGPWANDLGIVYSVSGAALTPVLASPTVGQYSVSAGVYTFSSADAGAALAISYGFVPQDIVQAALELSAERFRASDRIGLRSKSLGGQETIAYDTSAISAPVLALLQPYKRVAI
jgi:hypothetical protein